LRVASKGGIADYSGITWERVEKENGVCWPCPSEGHPGTPRLFEQGSWNPVARGAGPFYFPDGKARFNVALYSPPAEDVDADYPIILTTGRVVSHFLSGTQTRRIGPLVDQYPEPKLEIHPQLAAKLGVGDGETVTVESRRGAMTLPAHVRPTQRTPSVQMGDRSRSSRAGGGTFPSTPPRTPTSLGDHDWFPVPRPIISARV
jgi:assimilatory nitrate reductase catalytic subunit